MRLDRAALLLLAGTDLFEKGIKAVPGGEKAAWRAASRYVAGTTQSEALDTANGLIARGHGVSLDLVGESATDADRADRVVDEYLALIPLLPAGAWLSVDLSHLALGADRAAAADRLTRITSTAGDDLRVQVGAEASQATDAVLACVLEVAERGYADRLGATLQANLRRSAEDVDALAAAGVHVRLVKGAYHERAGAHSFGEPTDVAFLGLGFRLAERNARWSIATHDGRLREALLLALGPTPVEQLLGVRPDVLDELHQRGVPTRVYIPFGPEWFRYWIRRVAESRGA